MAPLPPAKTKPPVGRLTPVGPPKTPAPAPKPKAPMTATAVPSEERPGPIDPKDIGRVALGPPTITHYLPIPLGGTTPTPPVTGVFLPNGYPYLPEVDAIVFFHGNRDGGPTGWMFDTINQYWAGNYPQGEPPVLFRENLYKAGKRSVLLIAPTLGKYPGSPKNISDLGDFNTQAMDAPGAFLSKVLAELEKKDPRTKGTKIKKLILAGHSGGGNAVIRQLELMRGTASGITIGEVWVFDGIYVSTDRWNTAISANLDTTFYFHLGTAPQIKYANAIKGEYDKDYQEWGKETMYGEFESDMRRRFAENANFLAESKDGHFGALTKHFLTRLKEATWLK